jgi:dienelactone hydrolase
MQSQPSVEPSKIAFLGPSKGGEGALLASAVYREVRVVIAYSPSHVAFQRVNATWSKPKTSKSSWTLDCKPIPFVPLRVERHIVDRYGFYPGLYLGSLQDRQAVKRAAIPIERINGPILLISGTDDAIWPSSAMCGQAVERLRRCHFTFPFRYLKYVGAGHLLAGRGGFKRRDYAGL